MNPSPQTFATLSDRSLLEAFAHNASQDAFAELVRRHGGLVLSVCRRVLADAHGAEDAAQAVFLTLAQKAPTLGSRESVAAWLQKVAWYVACRARETGAIRRRHEQEAAAMSPQETPADSPLADLGPVLDEELAALPEKYRISLVLHHLEGKTVEEAADLMHTKTGTMAGWVSRGREMLRVRLARRGVALSATALVASLAIQQAQTVSAAFVASTAHAAALVAAGDAAATGVISTQSALLFKGTLKMMLLSKVKVAAVLMAAAAIPVAAGVATYQLLAAPAGAQVTVQLPAPAGKGAAAAPVQVESIAWPTKATPVDYTKLQAAALARKLDVSFRRANVSEVIGDLETRSGVRVAFAKSLAEGASFTLETSGITVKEALEKLAAELKLDLDFRPAAAVLTQKADETTFAALEKQLAATDRWERCQALFALGNLADPRIYPLLIQSLGDKDAGIVHWALTALQNHARMSLLWTDAQKGAVAAGVTQWLASLENRDSLTLEMQFGTLGSGMMRVWMPGPRPLARQPRLELLAATGRPQAIKALTDILTTDSRSILRRWAATGLSDSRVGAAELAQVLSSLNDTVAKAKADAAATLADLNKNRVPGEPVTITPDSPHVKAGAQLRELEMVRHDVIVGLLAMRVPEFVETAQSLINKDARSPMDTDLMLNGVLRLPDALDLKPEMQRAIKTIAPIYDIKEAVKPPNGQMAFATAAPEAHAAASALRTLLRFADADLTAELTRLAKHDLAYEALAEAVSYDPDFVLPVSDPALVAALLARTGDTGARYTLTLRSLSKSHAPAVADALIALLKDRDPQRAAEAGVALAATRDPRALPLLVALVKEKRKWPDFEEDDRITLASGGAVRPRTNPRKALVAAVLETRDPNAFTELAALATDTSKEVSEGARRRLAVAVASPADLQRFFEIVTRADPSTQSEILSGTASSAWSGFGVTAVKAPSWRVARDPRWIQQLLPGVDDPDAYLISRSKGQMVPRGNFVIDAISAVRSPLAEKTLLELCRNPSEHVAYFAGRALETFRDPKLDIRYER